MCICILTVKNKMSCPDFIKLDCQGSELDILDGALEAMKCVKVILVGKKSLCLHNLIIILNVFLLHHLTM